MGTPVIEQDNTAGPSKYVAHGVLLVVDDNMVNLRVASKMCRDIGFTVVTAADGLEALEKVEKSMKGEDEEFVCILMDGQMPRNGWL